MCEVPRRRGLHRLTSATFPRDHAPGHERQVTICSRLRFGASWCVGAGLCGGSRRCRVVDCWQLLQPHCQSAAVLGDLWLQTVAADVHPNAPV